MHRIVMLLLFVSLAASPAWGLSLQEKMKLIRQQEQARRNNLQKRYEVNNPGSTDATRSPGNTPEARTAAVGRAETAAPVSSDCLKSFYKGYMSATKESVTELLVKSGANLSDHSGLLNRDSFGGENLLLGAKKIHCDYTDDGQLFQTIFSGFSKQELDRKLALLKKEMNLGYGSNGGGLGSQYAANRSGPLRVYFGKDMITNDPWQYQVVFRNRLLWQAWEDENKERKRNYARSEREKQEAERLAQQQEEMARRYEEAVPVELFGERLDQTNRAKFRKAILLAGGSFIPNDFGNNLDVFASSALLKDSYKLLVLYTQGGAVVQVTYVLKYDADIELIQKSLVNKYGESLKIDGLEYWPGENRIKIYFESIYDRRVALNYLSEKAKEIREKEGVEARRSVKNDKQKEEQENLQAL